MSEEMSVVIDNSGYVYIKIPIDLLVFAEENNPDNPCKITDVIKMLAYFKNNFVDFGTGENEGSYLQRALDKFFEDATESGLDWIDYIPIPPEVNNE